MFTLDNRARIKGKEELAIDMTNIIKAMKDITGIKHYSYKNKLGMRVNSTNSNSLQDVVEVSILDYDNGSSTSGEVTLMKKIGLFSRETAIERYSALGYGQVVYLKSPTNKVYVWVNGVVILKVQFPKGSQLDLWRFSLHVQDSLKNHEFAWFKSKLSKDINFWKRIDVYSN